MPRSSKGSTLKAGALEGALVIYTDGACSGKFFSPIQLIS